MSISPRSVFRRSSLALIPSSLYLVLASVATVTGQWKALFPIPFPSLRYLDLAQVTYTASCIQSPEGWTIASESCDPFGRGYNYPSVWSQGLALLGLGSGDTEWLGVVQMLLLAVAIWLLGYMVASSSRPMFGLVALSAAAVSPPVFFAVERGNIEITVFAVAVLAVFLYWKRRRIASAALLPLAVLGKLVPVAGGGYFLVDGRKSRKALALFGALSTLAVLLDAGDLGYINERTPMRSTHVGFGSNYPAALLAVISGITPDRSLTLRLGGLALFALTALAIWAVARWKAEPVLKSVDAAFTESRVSSILLLFGGGVSVASYLTGVNSDYRLIWLLPVVAAFALLPVRSTGFSAVGTALVIVALFTPLAHHFESPLEWFMVLSWNAVFFPALAVIYIRLLVLTYRRA